MSNKGYTLTQKDHDAYLAKKAIFDAKTSAAKARRAELERKLAAAREAELAKEKGQTEKSPPRVANYGYVETTGRYSAESTSLGISFIKANNPYPITFPGFLTNFNDTFTQNVNKERVFGRMDPLHTYENTERTISFSWVVPASSEQEAEFNYGLVNELVKAMYPNYRKNQSGGYTQTTSALMGLSFHGLAHGNLSSNARSAGGANSSGDQYLYGYLENLSIEHDFEAGVFLDTGRDIDGSTESKKTSEEETAIESREVFANTMLARAIRINATFSPIHPETLGFDQSGDWISSRSFPYIGGSTADPPTIRGRAGMNEGTFLTIGEGNEFRIDPDKQALYDAYQSQLRAQEASILGEQKNPWKALGNRISNFFNEDVPEFFGGTGKDGVRSDD